jgi:hypothetical protein
MYQRDYRDFHALEPDPAYVRKVCLASWQRAPSLCVEADTIAFLQVADGVCVCVYIVVAFQLEPPIFWDHNPSTSITTKFVHSSVNQVKCPINCVAVRSPLALLRRCLVS